MEDRFHEMDLLSRQLHQSHRAAIQAELNAVSAMSAERTWAILSTTFLVFPWWVEAKTSSVFIASSFLLRWMAAKSLMYFNTLHKDIVRLAEQGRFLPGQRVFLADTCGVGYIWDWCSWRDSKSIS